MPNDDDGGGGGDDDDDDDDDDGDDDDGSDLSRGTVKFGKPEDSNENAHITVDFTIENIK